MPIVNVPKILRDKLGEDGVDALLYVFNHAGSSMAVSKKDLAEISSELKQEISKAGSELKQEITKVGSDLKHDVARIEIVVCNTQSELLKWNTVMWVTVLLSIIAAAYLFR